MTCNNCDANKTNEVQLLILALTGHCNLHCSYCYASDQIEQNMSQAVAEQALEYITACSVIPTIQFTGGEPLLAWDLLVHCVEWLNKRNIKTKLQIQTNATLLDEAKVSFIKKHNIAVGVSIDGIPEINRQNRPYLNSADSTEDTIRGIRLLSEQGIEIGITTVINATNVQHLHKLIELSYYLGNVRQIGFNLVRPQGRGRTSIGIDENDLVSGLQQMLQTLDYWQDLTKRMLIVSQVNKIDKLQHGFEPFSHCYALHKAGMYVSPDGKLYACASLAGHEEYCLGHVSSGVIRKLEESLLEKLEPVVDMCEVCDVFSYCGGACYSRTKPSERLNSLECVMKRIFINYYLDKQRIGS